MVGRVKAEPVWLAPGRSDLGDVVVLVIPQRKLARAGGAGRDAAGAIAAEGGGVPERVGELRQQAVGGVAERGAAGVGAAASRNDEQAAAVVILEVAGSEAGLGRFDDLALLAEHEGSYATGG